MSLYARSDVLSVSISAAHGGCGASHGRPVNNGAPARTWRLDCQQCETVLKEDPLWAATVSEIPETPDEQHVREDRDKRGAKEQSEATAQALAELAKLGDLPAALAGFTDYMTRQAVGAAGDVVCPAGHRGQSGARFCAVCGASMDAVPPPAEVPSLEYAVDSHVVEDVPLPEPPAAEPPLESLPYSELKRLAATMGLSGKGTKPELLERLHAAEAA